MNKQKPLSHHPSLAGRKPTSDRQFFWLGVIAFPVFPEKIQ
jgi:hypothetical protein